MWINYFFFSSRYKRLSEDWTPYAKHCFSALCNPTIFRIIQNSYTFLSPLIGSSVFPSIIVLCIQTHRNSCFIHNVACLLVKIIITFFLKFTFLNSANNSFAFFLPFMFPHRTIYDLSLIHI